jgi:hypothetical protein
VESGGGSGCDHGQPIEMAVVGVGCWRPKLVCNFTACPALRPMSSPDVSCGVGSVFGARYLAC